MKIIQRSVKKTEAQFQNADLKRYNQQLVVVVMTTLSVTFPT